MFSNSFPIKYDEPLFRPPAEAYSLILQVTYGCTWNKCVFCDMYSTKTFKVRKEEDVFAEIDAISKVIPNDLHKAFLADGNPMALSSGKLINILNYIKQKLPKIRKVSTYALPADILSKSVEELKELRNLGLKLLYVGIESGDDEILKFTNKSETYKSTVEGLLKAKEAGISLSVMILNGLGGQKYSHQHALNSAKIVNEVQPEFLSTLVLSFPFGIERYVEKFGGDYKPMTITDLLIELRTFISCTELSSTIFRSDHASNYLALEGILNRDKQRIINELEFAISDKQKTKLRPEWMRGL